MGHFPLARPLAAAAATLLLLAGCGEDSSEDTTTPASGDTSPSASGPDCSEIWTGDKLPKNYRGCVSDGEMVEAERQRCATEQVLVTYDDRYYAVLGGPINDVGAPLEDSQQYRQATRSCGG